MAVDTNRGPLFAVINAAANGQNVVIANADTRRRIKVLSYAFVCAGIVNVTFCSDSTPLSGAMPFVASTGMSAAGGKRECPLMQTAVGQDLELTLSGAVLVAGHITYCMEP